MAATSSLSPLSRTPTPFSACHTADEGASNPGEDVTDISSPGEAGDEGFTYHQAKELPNELRSRCQIHIEEQTYAAALDLLNSLLCEGMSNINGANQPILVPPASQLGVLATLAVQPKHTSKLANSDNHDIASLSLAYLRNLFATVGPIHGNLRDAFIYRGDTGRRRRSFEILPHNGPESDDDHIRGKTANTGSVWVRGQDFWKVLGWAFNCSALYPHRWRWWKPWLEYMVDVLYEDYNERKRLDLEQQDDKDCSDFPMVRNSLLVSYIAPKNSRSSPLKAILCALFADGSTSSTSTFREVFKNETKIASTTSKKRKRHHLDLENDNFGDYDDGSSTGGSEPPTPEHQRMQSRIVDESVPWTSTSLAETISLRLRIFTLLSQAVDDVPKSCNIKLSDLYERFSEKVAQQPVPAFARLIAQHDSPLDELSLVAIIQLLMPIFLPPAAPDPRDADPQVAQQNKVSSTILEQCYLPFAYRTAENNAKLSLAIETIFRFMWRKNCVQWTPSLQQAVEKGVTVRYDKSMPKKNSRKEDSESSARETLRASGSRILTLAQLLKLQAP